MKKFVLPIVLAAVIGIGSGITAVIINKANVANADETIPPEPEVLPKVKTGTYYLNGDKNSEVWMEVNSEFFIVKGKDLDASIKKYALISHRKTAEDLSEEFSGQNIDWDYVGEDEINEIKALLCTEKDYLIKSFIPQQSAYLLYVNRTAERVSSESLEGSTAGFIYNSETNTIEGEPFGDFILVE